VQRIATEQRGIPFPVLRSSRSLEQHLAASRIVENTVAVTPAAQTVQVDEPVRVVPAAAR
jgi:hypothetical protein